VCLGFPPPAATAAPAVPTLAQLQALADVAGAESEYRPMILGLRLCGLRCGKCAALRVRSVDLLGRRLRVTEAVSEVNEYLVWSTPKTHQARDVPVPKTLVDELMA
jgi:integrase